MHKTAASTNAAAAHGKYDEIRDLLPLTIIPPVTPTVTLEIPLVDGETVLSEHVTATEDRVLVSMEPTQRAVPSLNRA